MRLSRKLTTEEEALRAELLQLEERINLKIRKITWTHQKLPYERLTKGRLLKDQVLTAISYLDQGKKGHLRTALSALEKAGIPINSNPWKKTPGSSGH